jgi:hypothetical protein
MSWTRKERPLANVEPSPLEGVDSAAAGHESDTEEARGATLAAIKGQATRLWEGSPTGLMSPVAPAVEVMVAKGVRDNKRLGGSSTLAGRS